MIFVWIVVSTFGWVPVALRSHDCIESIALSMEVFAPKAQRMSVSGARDESEHPLSSFFTSVKTQILALRDIPCCAGNAIVY